MWRLKRATTTRLPKATPDPMYVAAQPTTTGSFGLAAEPDLPRNPAKIPLMLPVLRMQSPCTIKKHPARPVYANNKPSMETHPSRGAYHKSMHTVSVEAREPPGTPIVQPPAIPVVLTIPP
jgi:hypothetical protein